VFLAVLLIGLGRYYMDAKGVHPMGMARAVPRFAHPACLLGAHRTSAQWDAEVPEDEGRRKGFGLTALPGNRGADCSDCCYVPSPLSLRDEPITEISGRGR